MSVKIVQKKLTVKSLAEKMQMHVSVSAAATTMSKATELHNAGCELVVTMTRLAIKRNGVVIGTESLKMAAVTLCIQHKLGAAPTKIIRSKIIQLIANAYQKHLDLNLTESVKIQTQQWVKGYDHHDVKAHVMEYIVDGNKIAAIKAHRNLTGASLKIAKVAIDIWWDEHHTANGNIDPVTKATPDGTTLEEIKNFEKDWSDLKTYPGNYKYAVDLGVEVMPLASATMLHESVAGTGPSSRYHVIALSEFIKVAVRIGEDNSVALRAAINGHPNSKEAQHAKSLLLSAGLDKKTGGHYSLHLKPETLDMAKRSIGAILFSISSFDQISGQLHVLLGKGA